MLGSAVSPIKTTYKIARVNGAVGSRIAAKSNAEQTTRISVTDIFGMTLYPEPGRSYRGVD